MCLKKSGFAIDDIKHFQFILHTMSSVLVLRDILRLLASEKEFKSSD